ncbi:aldose 1-epimerase family protein [Roseimaritima ulvae]|uniref:DUF4432 domain-containing protein n=1 Tax=Roseimaritima ulvae TaxID=980254 RepID=A0A5B9QS87_9BACT|nr:aldose 1-epimerase family protein [Roseimaritima ulvae]QEG40769.1 hypothetical protein UC8_27860 [Roseimaritima ulvae]
MDFEQIAAERVRWEDEPSLCAVNCSTTKGTITLRRGHFVDGAAAGVEVVSIDTGAVRVIVLPSRGMAIWRMESAGKRFGWQSPVAGPVHPSLVPVFDPGGIGWLEGFDELLVRCGLESNGAPQWNDAGQLEYPLHGRIANLPASVLKVEVDPESGRLTLEGVVTEARLFIKRLELRSRLTVTAGETSVEIEDTVTNGLSRAATAQMLYHINVGPPVLGPGAELQVASQEVKGKDEQSQAEIAQWNQIGEPQSGYAERVYFVTPESSDGVHSAALLKSADGTLGLGVQFDTRTLPQLVVWKNTAAMDDGYVVGIEPATNLPNTRGEETAAGRVVTLEAGESVTFRVRLQPMTTAVDVADYATQQFG